MISPSSMLRWFRPRNFDDLVEAYLAVLDTRELAPKTMQQRRSEVKHLAAAFTGIALKSIAPHHIAAVVNGLAASGKRVTARHVLTAAQDVFNEALVRGWLGQNPALHVKRPKAPVLRQRLTLEQWRSIHDYGLTHMPEWFAPAMVLALVSGQRRSDLVQMQFDDVRDSLLYIEQHKTGTRIALPVALQLVAIDMSLMQAIDACQHYSPSGPYMLRPKSGNKALGAQSLSNRFAEARDGAGVTVAHGNPPSLHEVRSLSERLYRAQGVDTQTLLGHKHARMTELYNDDRGLTRSQWKVLFLPNTIPE